MPLNTSERVFLSLVRRGLGMCNNTESDDVLSGLTPDADLTGKLFGLAAEQKLLPVMYEGAVKSGIFREDVTASMRTASIAQVISQTKRSEAFSAVYSHLIGQGLHPLVVKGRVCAALYPLSDSRLSSDDDVFIPAEEFRACLDELISLGLTIDDPDKGIEGAYEVSLSGSPSPGNVQARVHIELHRYLFNPCDVIFGDFNRYFDDAFTHQTEYPDAGVFSMPPEEHLLYLILHAYKHFVSRGVGVRQFCDIGLWAYRHRGVIDSEKLRLCCREARAEVFAAAVFDIAREYLGIPVPSELTELPEGISSLPLLCDSLDGGIYGSSSDIRLHSSTVTLDAVASDRNGVKSSPLRSVFPPLDYMVGSFPYLKKHPALLPLSWASRILRYASGLSHRCNPKSASDSLRLGKERAELLRLYGII